MVLAVPVILSPFEITDIFMSHYRCYRYPKIPLMLINLDIVVFITLLLDPVIYCIMNEIYICIYIIIS